MAALMILMLVLPLTVLSQDDPCKDYIILYDDGGRSIHCSRYHRDSHDRFITEGWRRVQLESTRDDLTMPTQCIQHGYCGSHSNVWLNGTHPTVEDGIVDRMGCLSMFSSCCYAQYPIQIKNCTDYMVYNLKRTLGSDERYCFGDSALCNQTTRPTTVSTTMFATSKPTTVSTTMSSTSKPTRSTKVSTTMSATSKPTRPNTVSTSMSSTSKPTPPTTVLTTMSATSKPTRPTTVSTTMSSTSKPTPPTTVSTTISSTSKPTRPTTISTTMSSTSKPTRDIRLTSSSTKKPATRPTVKSNTEPITERTSSKEGILGPTTPTYLNRQHVVVWNKRDDVFNDSDDTVLILGVCLSVTVAILIIVVLGILLYIRQSKIGSKYALDLDDTLSTKA